MPQWGRTYFKTSVLAPYPTVDRTVQIVSWQRDARLPIAPPPTMT